MFKGARAIRHQIVDVFSMMPFCGNAAGIVTNASDLKDEEMQKIAREINISNTSFILQPQNGGDLQIRYFCPESEINMCGHATIGSIFAWGEENLKEVGQNAAHTLNIETKVGTLPVKIKRKNGRISKVAVSLPSPEFKTGDIDKQELFAALNIDARICVGEYPIEIVNSSLKFIEVGIKNRKSLLGIQPDFGELKRITAELDVDAVQVFTLDTFEEEDTVLSRTFFPRYGVNEDPVCGTGNAAVASYLIHNGIINSSREKIKVIGEQGHSVSRPGKVFVEAKYRQGQIEDIRISGSAALVFDGYIFI